MLGRRSRERVSKARKRVLDALKRLPIIKQNDRSAEIRDDIRESTTPSSPVMTGLRVNVTVRFESPLDKIFNNIYETSPDFNVTDHTCAVLLGRIEHCARELITRYDSNATHPIRHTEPRMKPARFHLIFRVDRRGMPMAERYFTSFQSQSLTMDAAQEVVLETDRIIGLFLQTNDPGYTWGLPSFVTEEPLLHKAVIPAVCAPQSTHCIPSYGGEAGYTIELSLRIRGHGHKHERHWPVKIESQQDTPLTLHLGEALMSHVTRILGQAVMDREERFVDIHTSCNSLEGTYGCQHLEESAFDMTVKIRNNLGPDYPHFSTRFLSFWMLLGQGDGASFVGNLKEQLETARDMSDGLINGTDDLVFTIHELRSRDWKIHNPVTVVVNSSATLCRKVVERILERVVTGVEHVLQGHGAVAALTAHKRGHLIFEKTICWGEDTGFYDLKSCDPLDLQKRVLQQRLRDQVQVDIAMVCKDTCSLGDPEPIPRLTILTPDDAAVEPLSASAAETLAYIIPPSRRLSKKSPLPDLRRRSIEDAEAAESKPTANIVQDYGYMADIVSEKSDSLHVTTPSLADTASINLQDGARTPESARAISQKFAVCALDDDCPDSTAQRSRGYVEESSMGTVIYHPQPLANKAIALLASYWECGPPQNSVIDEPKAGVVCDLSVDPNIWNGGRSGRKVAAENVAHEMMTENIFSMANNDGNFNFPREEDSVNSLLYPDNLFVESSTPIKQREAPGIGSIGQPSNLGVENAGQGKTAQNERTATPAFTMWDLEPFPDSMRADDSTQAQSTALARRKSSKPLNSFSRRASDQAAPTSTLVHASGFFHRRQTSFPAGGHLGLHGEWVVERGLRNALVPSHTRTPQTRQGLQSSPNSSPGGQNNA